MKRHILHIDSDLGEIGKIQNEIGLGLNWTQVSCLVDARRKLAEENFDLIIMEADLSDGDGFHFCSWINKHPIYQKIPVIFLTKREGDIEKKHALQLGAHAYLTKPSSILELKEAIQKSFLSPTMPGEFIEGIEEAPATSPDATSQDPFAERP